MVFKVSGKLQMLIQKLPKFKNRCWKPSAESWALLLLSQTLQIKLVICFLEVEQDIYSQKAFPSQG